ncbi:MAG: class I SAM-dependent methyltransferase [Gemmataceae bacterium]
MFDPRAVLSVPAVYRLFGRLIGGNSRERVVRSFLRPNAGDRVLDLGCGPGNILDYLPPCDYVGVDADEGYIAEARQRYGTRGEFRHGLAEEVDLPDASFDLAFAFGLLHHLTDEQALSVLSVARRVLKPGGRLVTLDGCFEPGQALLARLLLKMDRGRHVRTRPAYLALAGRVFGRVTSELCSDLLRVPYTLLIVNSYAD